MARVRTQKAVASRIDLNYHTKPHPWRSARVALVVLCTLAAGAWFAFSSVRFQNGRPVLVDKVHNPGPVARAHAQIEQDCRQCHDGNGEKGYWLNVSDAACLKCHDGSLHHADQKIAESHAGVDTATFVRAVKNKDHPAGAMSANCVSCHIEHRGHEALAGSSDQHCVTCHENVNRSMQPGTTATTAARIVSFSTADHPRFGQKLDPAASASGDFTWVDPTDVKYNHAKLPHANIPALGGATSNCTRCHEVSNVPVALTRAPEDLEKYPPFDSPTHDVTMAFTRESKYVQPISYERHCIGCHQMKLPAGGPAIPHEDMSVVRAGLANLPNDMIGGLRSMSEEDRKKQLTIKKKESNRPGAKTIETTRGEDEWLTERLTNLAKEVNKTAGTAEGGADVMKRVGESGDWLFEGKPVKGPSSAAMEFYVAFASSEGCARCHSLNMPTASFGAAAAAPTTGPAAAPASPSVLLATNPTRIPDHPRRWFGSSSFDHYAHRQMDCLGCHNAATKSEKTSDVLTADIDGRYSGARALGVPNAPESCVSCHHPTNTTGLGAPSNCVTCHEYHDHKFERSLDNPMGKVRTTALTGAPTTAPSGAAPQTAPAQ